jgi:hypothetical protein
LVCVCYLAAATPAQIRYSLRRLRRTAVDTFILVVVAGTVDMDEKILFPSGEQGNLIQVSLTKTVMKIKSIAAGSDKCKETTSDTSGGATPSVTPKGQPELHTI